MALPKPVAVRWSHAALRLTLAEQHDDARARASLEAFRGWALIGRGVALVRWDYGDVGLGRVNVLPLFLVTIIALQPGPGWQRLFAGTDPGELEEFALPEVVHHDAR